MGATISSLVLLLFLSSAGGQKTWCFAKPSSDELSLLANVNSACSQVDCRVLQKGCPCFYPDNLMNQGSVALNLYYQAKRRNKRGTAISGTRDSIAITDPSYMNCLSSSHGSFLFQVELLVFSLLNKSDA